MDKYVYETVMTFHSTNVDQATALKNDLLSIAKDGPDILGTYFPEYAGEEKNCGTVASMYIGGGCTLADAGDDENKRYIFDVRITGCGDADAKDRVFPESVYAAAIKKYYPAVRMEYRRYVYSESLYRKDGCGTGLEAVYGYGDGFHVDSFVRGNYACAVLKRDDEEGGFASFDRVFGAYDARDIYGNMGDCVDEEEYGEKYFDCDDKDLPELWGDLDSEIDDKGYIFSAATWKEVPVKDLPFAGSTVDKFDVRSSPKRNISKVLKERAGDKGGK